MHRDYISSGIAGSSSYSIHSGAVAQTIYYLPKDGKVGNYTGHNC